MAIYQHIRHPRITERLADRPVKVADLLPRGTAVSRFNTGVALLVTKAVGSMWCAYAFALFDLISLPDAIHAGTSAIVSWVAQTFLQLVLLSVIMVGQNVQSLAADARSNSTYRDAEVILDRLDVRTQGGLKAILDRLDELAPSALASVKDQGLPGAAAQDSTAPSGAQDSTAPSEESRQA